MSEEATNNPNDDDHEDDEEEEEEEEKPKRVLMGMMDKGLEEYYKSIEVNYFNDEGVGKFWEFCDENGFDDEDLEEELENDPEDCMILEFDENFPLEKALYYEHELLTFGYIRRYLINNDQQIDFEIPLDLIKLFAQWFSIIDNIREYKTDKEREEEIFSILKYIQEHEGKPPQLKSIRFANLIDVSKMKVTRNDITDEILARSKQMYQKAVPLWFEGPSKEQSILFFIAVREINDGDWSFLQLMIDCYNRTRALSKWAGNKFVVNTTAWSEKCKFMLDLKNEEKRAFDELVTAVRIFCTKNAPPIQFNPLYRIYDSVYVISKYIMATSQLIKMLIHDNSVGFCPFQCDLVFGIEVIDPQKMKTVLGIEATDSDIEAETDSDSDDGYDFRDRMAYKLAIDYIADLHSKLDHEELRYHKTTITSKNVETNKFIANTKFQDSKEAKKLVRDTAIQDQQFIPYYSETHPQWNIESVFAEIEGDDDVVNTGEELEDKKVHKLAQKFKEMYDNFRYKVSDDEKRGDNNGRYPRNRRFCIFVDRRGKDRYKGEIKDDEVTFYEPPAICRRIPDKHLPEHYFETCRYCIIPRRGYGNGQNEQGYPDKPPPNDCTISAQTAISGKVSYVEINILYVFIYTQLCIDL